MVKSKNLDKSKKKVTRRTLLEWMGTGCVLSLGGGSLASCLAEPHDGGTNLHDAYTGSGFPFQPGAGQDSVFNNWGERTVDKQDLTQILQTWQLRVDGMVETPRTYTFADLVDMERTDMLVDFHCVEGWSILDVPWNGVHLTELFDQVKPRAGASHVTFHTIGGKYNESLPVEVALEPRTILAYGIAGATIPFKHGFPLRLVVPRLLAYKSPKYVDRIELTDRRFGGYWVAAGYPYEGEVDPSRLRPGKY